jgi:hypothetical protein
MMRYQGCGLIIESSAALPGWTPAADRQPPDITIREGDVPARLDTVTAQSALYQANDHELLYDLPDVLRFLARDGTEIIFAPAPGTDAEGARAFLVTAALAAALHQRRAYILQAAAVEIDGGAVLLAGPSGVGKSTLAAALFQAGYRVLADEFTLLRMNERGELVVMPGAPTLGLWRGALYNLGATDEQIDALPRVRPSINKHLYPVRRGFSLDPVPLRALYLMGNPVAKFDPVIALTPLQALTNLNWHLYYQRFAIDLGVMASYWQIGTQLVEKTRCARLLRVFDPFDFASWIGALLEDYRA